VAARRQIDALGLDSPAPVGLLDELAWGFSSSGSTMRWRRETGGISNPHKIVAHRCYRAIVAMGWNAVPLLLADLGESADPDLWGPALREITGETVTIAPDDVGRLDAVAKAWLALAETKGWLGSTVKAA